jgi:hypothetical protein
MQCISLPGRLKGQVAGTGSLNTPIRVTPIFLHVLNLKNNMNLPAAEQWGIKPSFRKTQRAYAWFDMLTTLSNVEGESRFPLSRE